MNDIVFFKFWKLERIKDLVKYVCLFEFEDKLVDGMCCYIVGWGK